MNTETNIKPPTNAQRISRVADLPQDRTPADYLVTTEGSDPKTVSLKKRKRQVLDLLMTAPVYAASPVRGGVCPGGVVALVGR